ncbi:MAG: TetR/AcrR family transcriptional regulator [Burkholderiales bacterium]|nr:MAG: TetR/AcrR family transcriptional regulator [Burkholderiales bacterium]
MNGTVHLALKTKRAAAKKPSAKKTVPAPSRTNDPARTMAEILKVATEEFAQKGLAGARIDEIAERTRTSKRMIYYYFQSKEGLYVKVLEEAYRRVRETEADLNLDDLPPEQALRRLVEFTFDHHAGNEDYIRLVMNENINRAQFLSQSKSIQGMNVPALKAIKDLYERGVSEGIFRTGLLPIDIHATISALSFFNVSNRFTFGTIFKIDMSSKAVAAKRREHVIETVVRFVRR